MKYVEYDESLHGKLTYPEGFRDMLEGLPLEEQMNYFCIGNGLYLKEEVSKRRKNEYDYSKPLNNEDRVEAILIHENLIAGVMVRNCYGKVVPCLPEQRFIIRDDSEIDGSGYKTLRLYLYLVCVTKEFNGQ